MMLVIISGGIVRPLQFPAAVEHCRYGTDLTAMAREGRLDPVIGRDEEIRRVIQILARRSKNNPATFPKLGLVGLSGQPC